MMRRRRSTLAICDPCVDGDHDDCTGADNLEGGCGCDDEIAHDPGVSSSDDFDAEIAGTRGLR